MKSTIPSALQTHYDQGQTTTAFGVKITRQDGQVFAFTSATWARTASSAEASAVASSALVMQRRGRAEPVPSPTTPETTMAAVADSAAPVSEALVER